jgi:hypothetical protein
LNNQLFSLTLFPILPKFFIFIFESIDWLLTFGGIIKLLRTPRIFTLIPWSSDPSEAYAKVFWSIAVLSDMIAAIPVVLMPKNWFVVLSEYVQTPEVPFWYKNDKVPELGNPRVESTSIKVWAMPTCPIIFVLAWFENSP